MTSAWWECGLYGALVSYRCHAGRWSYFPSLHFTAGAPAASRRGLASPPLLGNASSHGVLQFMVAQWLRPRPASGYSKSKVCVRPSVHLLSPSSNRTFSVVTWGHATNGGNSGTVQDLLREVQQILSAGHSPTNNRQQFTIYNLKFTIYSKFTIYNWHLQF